LEVDASELKQAVESLHGGRAKFVQAVPVHEERGGQTVWDGAVHVFNLMHQPDGAFRAYAWSYELPSGDRRFFAILHGGPIGGPKDAVSAALAAEANGNMTVQQADRCRACFGTGTVAAVHDAKMGRIPAAPPQALCPKCAGTGRVPPKSSN